MQTTSTIDKLYTALEKHQRQLEALRSVSLRLTRNLDAEWVMQQAVEAVCNVLGVEAAAISVVDTERDELVICAQRGLKAFAHEPVRLPKGVGLAWETLLNQETIIIQSWENEPRLAAPAFLDEQIRSTILMPMLINGEPMGVLSAMTRTNHTFTPDEQNLMAGIADQVAVALLNARLYEQTRQQAQERAFLANLTTAIAPLHEIEEVAQTALEDTLAYLGWPAGVFLVAAEDEDAETAPHNDALIPLAQVGCDAHVQSLISGTDACARRSGNQRIPVCHIHSEEQGATLHIPLQTRQRILGWMVLSTTERVHLPAQLQETLAAEGVCLGMALDNIQLHKQMREHTAQLEEMARLLREQEVQRADTFDDLAQVLLNPLMFIQSYPELLLDGGLGSLNSAQNEALTSIQEYAQLLANMARDLGAMKVADPEKLRLQLTDITALLTNAVDAARPEAEDKSIKLAVNVEADLPSILLDPQQILRAIEKLLNNAMRFTPPHGTVHIAARKDDDAMIRVAVTDTGPTIPQDERELLFKRLYHGGLERAHPGAGIELALAQRIVESHGGATGIESGEEGGSTFYFTLPVKT